MYKYTKKPDRMATVYNKSRIMRNAWYLKGVEPAAAFAAVLRKAWRNERLAAMTARIENRPAAEPRPYNLPTGAAFAAGCLDYYAQAGANRYLGD